MCTLRPITSSALQPSSRSAAWLNRRTVPCASMMTMPSTAVSTSALNRDALARASRSSWRKRRCTFTPVMDSPVASAATAMASAR